MKLTNSSALDSAREAAKYGEQCIQVINSARIGGWYIMAELAAAYAYSAAKCARRAIEQQTAFNLWKRQTRKAKNEASQ